ncbi:hypothetical protein PC116_g5596 [Phytophthora cactorum]|uniref:Uncharacterized protein n=1 Tax=Phytophthora cactorum TaxID=29920 RepID=A0A8T0ZPM2_9STRA|nr:hypothetical protein PC112_g5296 [Phytophthora cactorum]KAG2841035.1 hypothetical protein PC111_g3252 [Phytophthora cactorum]KAG2863996.1 hypothetical protein PC113_g4984 [Phytophthora cactorum]KAG2911076.1 hypothetical protein PC114_g9539 [Phytophthora cactorum]KAG2934525.1 hypothetical protein PC115_g5157 [Phytophthora cactorum]
MRSRISEAHDGFDFDFDEITDPDTHGRLAKPFSWRPRVIFRGVNLARRHDGSKNFHGGIRWRKKIGCCYLSRDGRHFAIGRG